MKNYFNKLGTYLTFSFALIFLASCGDDAEEGGASSELVGTWSVSSIDIDFQIDNVDFIDWFVAEAELTQSEANEIESLFETLVEQEYSGTLEFKSDNTYTANLGGESDAGTYSLNDGILTIDSNLEDPFQASVLTLNGSTLVLEFDEVESEDLNDDGTSESLETTITMNLTK